MSILVDEKKVDSEGILREMLERAEEKASEQEQHFKHRWFTTIIPVRGSMEPCVVNYCPNCRKVVTQLVEYTIDWTASTNILDLPREGCDPPPPGI
jgi:hypothetical protein